MWGFGAMNAAAIKEAAAIHFPMDHFIGSWHAGSEDDVQPAGAGAKGYLALNFNGVGADYPAIQEIVKHVVDTGNSQAAREKVGENLYDRGVYVGVLIAEAIRTAQRLSGRRADHRQGHAPRARVALDLRGPVGAARPAGFRKPAHRHFLQRPQRPPVGLCPAMERHPLGASLRLDRADDGAAAPDPRRPRPRITCRATRLGRSARNPATSRRDAAVQLHRRLSRRPVAPP